MRCALFEHRPRRRSHPRDHKTITFRSDFVLAIRDRLKAAVADQVGSQRLIREQTEGQLARLATKEENLLDLAADGGIDTRRVRARLRDIAAQRRDLELRLTTISDDVEPGAACIDAHVALLERQYELYRCASDEARRQLNQVIFKRIYVVNEEVTGDELNTPMREVLAAGRGWASFSVGADLDAETSVAVAHAEQHGPVPMKAGHRI